MFADDTNLFFTGNNLSELENNVNCELVKISHWFKLNKLSLNIQKTNYILFCSKQNQIINAPVFKIDNCNISKVVKTKFLGIIINQSLTWTDHISLIKQKVAKNLGIITHVRNSLPLSVLKTLYNTMIHPYFEYCNVIWAIHRSTALKKLNAYQKSSAHNNFLSLDIPYCSPVSETVYSAYQ